VSLVLWKIGNLNSLESELSEQRPESHVAVHKESLRVKPG